MRILTVRQPWALHIIQSGKDVENRNRNIAGSYRGPVAIHAALKADEQALRDLPGLPPNGIPRVFRYGFIIGVVDLVGVHHAGDCYAQSIDHAAHLYRTDRAAFDALPVTNGSGGLLGRADYCSPWAEASGWHLDLANPRTLPAPIRFKGGLGLRTLGPEMAERIDREAVSS